MTKQHTVSRVAVYLGRIIITCLLVSACTDETSSFSVDRRDWDKEILAGLFKKPVTHVDPLLYPEVTNLEQLQQATLRINMPADTIFDAYKKISAIDLNLIQPHIFEFSYAISDQPRYQGYSYFKKGDSDSPSDTAYLIIPGSGSNEASQIFYSEETNYHCCLRKALQKSADLFVYVKPNNDFLAIHHNDKVLNGKVALYPQLLSMGYSYSTRYLVDAIALTKQLKSQYEKVVVFGLSQGGSAALIISLQAQPNAAIVASGFSILNSGPVYVAGINQIVVPGLLNYYTPLKIAQVMDHQTTQYLFTYGKKENPIYAYEAIGKSTEKMFSNSKNLKFHYHNGGHVFPSQAITDFLSDLGL